MSKKADWGDVLGTMGMTVAVGMYVTVPPLWIVGIAAGLGYQTYKLSKRG